MTEESRNALAQAARQLLHSVQGRSLSVDQLAQHSVQLAATMLKLSTLHRSREESERGELLGRMMDDPAGQAFTTLLADRALRTPSASLSVDQARYLLRELGTPRYLSQLDQMQMGVLKTLGAVAPSLAARGMRERIRSQANAYVLTGSMDHLERYIERRERQQVAVNVNHLGEEVIHEAEAKRRVADYLELIQQAHVRTLSVKISSIYSQVSALAFEHTVTTLCDRLRPIYEAALAHSSAGHPKLVYLDMEAYRDTHLTFECFRRLLSEPNLKELQAGLVLQAYLPDSFALQQQLIEFARTRVRQGGAALRLRIVKGANLAMERLESEQRGWTLPVFGTKAQTDANYRRMLLSATENDNARALHIGIASHNLFDLCFGLLLRAARGAQAHIEFELLEGMADSLCRALVDVGAKVLVYAPFVAESELPSALAYLVRRLDENTSKENFLRSGFAMRVGDPAWEAQKRLFLDACQVITPSISAVSRGRAHPPSGLNEPFRNEPDTDFVQADMRAQLQSQLTQVNATQYTVQSQVPGVESAATPDVLQVSDPSRPEHSGYTLHLADQALVEQALSNAVIAQLRFQAQALDERLLLLTAAARTLRAHRLELVALMLLDAAKRPEEGDVEVSEAVDFAEYYARSYLSWSKTPNVRLKPKGPTVVTPPWNFPLAIPMGGVFAALAAGNVVILKPALETALIAQRACELCWEAGIPRDVLQFVVCQDEVGERLIVDSRVQVVVLTGSTETARTFKRLRPDIPLLAETGGKNALYVSPMADRELAISDALASAFGHAGQKCSALSLLILHRDLYDDAHFLESLRHAALSLKVGSAWELHSRVTPLVQYPGAIQRRALTELAEGERWLLEPHIDPGNPRLVSPGIKLGVKPGSFSHQTEFFCPVLSVMRASDIKEALQFANGTAYGLTSGIHSLDEREQLLWLRGAHAGNLYVNRKITGAIVERQPFGGLKDSSFGPGAKAGGPSYVAQFVTPHAIAAPQHPPPSRNSQPLQERVSALLRELEPGLDPAAQERLKTIALGYYHDYLKYYHQPVDPSHVLGEDNLLLWLPCEPMLIVADTHTGAEMIARSVVAATICGVPSRVLVPEHSEARHAVAALRTELYSSEEQVFDKIGRSEAGRVRYLGSPGSSWYRGLVGRNCHLATGLPSACGRFELLNYLREQTWSISTHRYGHLTPPELHRGWRAQ